MKNLNRISRLLTALIIVMLLNIVLLLLPSALKSKDSLKSVEGQTSPQDTELNISQNTPVSSKISSEDAHINSGSRTDYNSSDKEELSEESNTVTLCLMGDLMCLAGQQYTAEQPDGSHDYTDSFYLLRDTFSTFDFVIGNLETTLSESNPYSTKEREVNEQPNCNAPADYLSSLKWAGITHLVTANNHSLDGGLVGIEETIAHLDEYEIPHTGTYCEKEDGAHYMMMEKNGIRIAVLSFTELINQRALVTKTQLAKIIDSYSKANVKANIAKAREDGADFVIVYEHWGSENVHEVRDYQKSHAKEIAEAGADLIIGSHPHCLQEMEYISISDGRSVPCFYSLGNVVSSMTRDINHDTVFVQVCLERSAESISETAKKTDTLNSPATSVTISSLTWLPCHVLTAFDGHSRVIAPVDYKTSDKKTVKELSEAGTRIEKILVLPQKH